MQAFRLDAQLLSDQDSWPVQSAFVQARLVRQFEEGVIPMRRNFRRIVTMIALLCISAFGNNSQGPSPISAEILWDTWGVPHIFSHDDASAFRALGWAEMHNHGKQLLHLYALARGRGAEYFGATDLSADRMVHTLGLYSTARQWYALQPQTFRSYLDSFAQGINLYARHHSS